jgi:hypothetical protein
MASRETGTLKAKTVTITRVGTNQRYADGWEAAFSGKRTRAAAGKSSAKKAAPSKKSAGKKASKKAKR